jgi:hypothetical protein
VRYAAGPGYDLVTGMGTPMADQLVPALAAVTGNGTPAGVVPAAPVGPVPGSFSAGSSVMHSRTTDLGSLDLLELARAGNKQYAW